MRVGVILLALSFIACQSREAGLKVVCDAPVDCAECMSAAPEMRSMMLAQHITEKLSNAEVQALMERMATMSPEERYTLLEDEVRAAGLASCPLIDALKEIEVGGPDEDAGDDAGEAAGADADGS